MTSGLDVAHWQGAIDWRAVAASGRTWAATKATEGVAYVDPSLRVNRAGMAAAGLRHRGLYHWLSPGTETAAHFQALWFLSTVGQLAPGEFVMLDAEQAGIDVLGAARFCQTVEGSTGRPVAVYTGATTAGLWQAPTIRNGLCGARPMVLAAWVSETQARASVAEFAWDAWQYTDAGTCPGVPERCDLDRIDNPGAFDRAAGLPTIGDDEMSQSDTIVTNADQFFASPPNEAKFLLLASGKLRHLGLTEWQTRGSDQGTPWTNAQIGAAGVVA